MGSPVDDALDRLASRTWVNYESREKDLATVREALERLREERDAAQETAKLNYERVRRLTEGLREIERGGVGGVRAFARALLADSPDGANTEGGEAK